jgi:hypothetical protein
MFLVHTSQKMPEIYGENFNRGEFDILNYNSIPLSENY